MLLARDLPFRASLLAASALRAPRRTRHHARTAFLTFALGAISLSAAAQDRVWNGTTSSSFNDPLNWTPNNVPNVGGERPVFGAGSATTTVQTSGNVTLGGILFDATAPSHVITLGQSMTITANVVNLSGRAQTINIASGFTLDLQGSAATGEGVIYNPTGDLTYRDSSVGGNSVINIFGRVNLLGTARTITMGSLSGNRGTLLRNLSSGAITLNVGALNTSTTFGGTINAGSGGLTIEKAGTGTLTLTGGNTITGVTVSGGTLRLGSNNAAGGSAGAITTTGSVISYAAGVTIATPITINSNTTQLEVLNADTATQSGVISEAGGARPVEKIGTGTLILTGANTYSGTTEVTAGTLQIGTGGTTGTGNVVVTTPGALVFNRSDSSIFGNAISGSGSVTVSAGDLILTGANTYSGTTSVTAGILQVGNGGTTGTLGTSAVVVSAPGRLVFNRSDTITVSNVISGTGSVTQAGSGTLILTGANTYADATRVNNGVLQVGDGGTTGRVGANILVLSTPGRLAFNRSDLIGVGNFITGTGSVTQAGSGTLILTGNNNYSGTTSVTNGTLQIGAGGLDGRLGTGTVLLSSPGRLVFNRADDVTLGNQITGTGSLTQAGSGTLILTGANTYSGTTSVTAGTLQIGDGGTTGTLGAGDVVLSTPGALVFNRSDAITIGNAISGTGSLTQAGSGTLILTGANSYTGTTSVTAGTLQIGDGGTTGTLGTGNVVLATPGALMFNRSDTITIGNAISGTGSVTQAGSGTLILVGTNTYTGATAVSAGMLLVNGSIATSSGVTVTGGTLGGIGTLPATSVMAGGTLSPGNSVGTLTVNGSLTLAAGSTTIIEVQGTTADRINVTGAASLAGTLRLVPLGGSYAFNTPYTLIQAASVTGTFGTVTTAGSFGPAVTPNVSVTATQVQLSLAPAPIVPIIAPAPAPVIGPRGSRNQVDVAAGLDRAVAAGGNVSAFFPLYNLPAESLPRGLDLVSGQVHAVAAGLHAQPAFQFMTLMLDPFRRDAPANKADGTPGSDFTLWGSAFGGGGRLDGDRAQGSATTTSNGGGVAVGVDIALSPEFTLGFALSGAGVNSSLGGGLGRAEATQIQGGAYATTRLGAWRLAAAASLGATEVTTRRQLGLFGAGNIEGQYTGYGASTRIEAGYQLGAFTPTIAFQGSWYDMPSFTETATGSLAPAALAVAGRVNATTRVELGVRAEAALAPGLEVFGRLAWAAYLQRDAGMQASFVGLPGSGFIQTGARPDAHAALLAVGIDWQASPQITLTARGDAELSGNARSATASLRVRYAF